MKQLLQKMFNHYNKTLFDSVLNIPNFDIDLSRKFPMRFLDGTIFVGIEIPHASLFDLHHMLIHEMVHVHNSALGNEDVGINQYHNKFFFAKCLELGFFVVRHGTQGWCLNTIIPVRNIANKSAVKNPDHTARERLIKAVSSCNIDRTEYNLAINNIRREVDGLRPVKTYFLKYVCRCPEPHNSIRSGRRPDGRNALDITCNRCNCAFTCVSD